MDIATLLIDYGRFIILYINYLRCHSYEWRGHTVVTALGSL